MELVGTSYLYTLAAISITFVAFSTIVVIFREAQGAGLEEYEITLLRLFVVSGLEATVFSLIPPLLGLFGIIPAWVWRISSLIFALVLIWRGIYFRRRQSHFNESRGLKMVYILYAIYALAILGLLTNALGIFVKPGPGLYALAATWLLINAILAFIMALERFMHPPLKE
jgi:hypothetical protein